MAPGGRKALISVKPDLFRHPTVIALGGALLAALIAVNVLAFMEGTDSPRLLGAVILADMLAVSVTFLGVAWAVAVWGGRSQATEARLDAIVDSAMDAIITVDSAQKVV